MIVFKTYNNKVIVYINISLIIWSIIWATIFCNFPDFFLNDAFKLFLILLPTFLRVLFKKANDLKAYSFT